MTFPCCGSKRNQIWNCVAVAPPRYSFRPPDGARPPHWEPLLYCRPGVIYCETSGVEFLDSVFFFFQKPLSMSNTSLQPENRWFHQHCRGHRSWCGEASAPGRHVVCVLVFQTVISASQRASDAFRVNLRGYHCVNTFNSRTQTVFSWFMMSSGAKERL